MSSSECRLSRHALLACLALALAGGCAEIPEGYFRISDYTWFPTPSGHGDLRDVAFPEPLPTADAVLYPDADGEDHIARTFRLTCCGRPVIAATLRLHAEGRTRVYHGDADTQAYQTRVRKGGGVRVTVPAGAQGDVAWGDFEQAWADFDLASRETLIDLRGLAFDGRYIARAFLNTATTEPRDPTYFRASNRFVVFRADGETPALEGRTLVYDRVLRCVWHYPPSEPLDYAAAERLAAGLGGTVPSLDDLTTLITEHAVWQQTYLHPVFILHLGMEDVRVWAAGGARCVVFRRRYAPRVSRHQPAATLLVKLPEGLCPEALR